MAVGSRRSFGGYRSDGTDSGGLVGQSSLRSCPGLCQPVAANILIAGYCPCQITAASRDLTVTFRVFGVVLFPRPINCKSQAKSSGIFLEMGSRREIVTCELIRIIEASHWPSKGHPRRPNRQQTFRWTAITSSRDWR